jgi:hypothetical protein
MELGSHGCEKAAGCLGAQPRKYLLCFARCWRSLPSCPLRKRERCRSICRRTCPHKRQRPDFKALVWDGIAFRIQGIEFLAVDGSSNGPLLIMRIPKSWAAPHQVTFDSSWRFYSRNSTGTSPLDLAEIRSALSCAKLSCILRSEATTQDQTEPQEMDEEFKEIFDS